MGRIADAFRNAWRDFASDGVPSSGLWNPRKPDIRPIGTTIEEEMATAVSVPIAAERQERQAADTALGGRIDTVENIAYSSTDTYESVAAGLAGTSSGQQFQVEVGDDIVRYRNESGTAVEVSRMPSAKVASAIAQNIRTAGFLSRDKFVANEITGPYRGDTGVSVPNPTWSVDGSGSLVTAVTGGTAGTIYRFWDAGYRWLGRDILEIEVMAEMTDLSFISGPAVSLGEGASTIFFTFLSSGLLGVYASNGNTINDKGGYANIPALAFGVGDDVSLKVTIHPDGSGILEARNGDLVATHPVHDIVEHGIVGPALRRPGVAAEVKQFSVRLLPVEVDEIPGLSSSVDDLDTRVSALEGGASAPASLVGFTVLPNFPSDRAPSLPPGFTSTGLVRVLSGSYSGCWLVGDDGRWRESGSVGSYAPAVHVMDMEFRNILTSFPMPYSGASIQGIAFDTSDGTFWVATAGDRKLRHFDMTGAEIVGDVFDWAAAGYASNPNGLCYDPVNDALWCSPLAGTTSRLISCDPGASPRLLDTMTTNGVVDHSQIETDRNLFWYTPSQGAFTDDIIIAKDMTTGSEVTVFTLRQTQSLEGFYIDRDAGMLFGVSDGGFHFGSSSPALNMAVRHKLIFPTQFA